MARTSPKARSRVKDKRRVKTPKGQRDHRTLKELKRQLKRKKRQQKK